MDTKDLITEENSAAANNVANSNPPAKSENVAIDEKMLYTVGGFLLLLGAITALVFALIGVFTTEEFLKMFIVLVACVANSIVLGAVVGIMSKNQQSATSLGMPVAVILAFTPMVANFNESIYNGSKFLYTQQLNIVTYDFNEDFGKAMLVITINFVVLVVLFTLAYKKRGLRG